MDSAIFKGCIILCLLFCTGCYDIKINRKWPFRERGQLWASDPDKGAAVRKGYVVRKNGDTLRGYVRLLDFYSDKQKVIGVPVLPFDKKEKKDIIRVAFDDIAIVRLYPPPETTAEDFVPLRSYMWQIVGRKGGIYVCEEYFFNPSAQDPGDRDHVELLVTGQQVTELPKERLYWGLHPSYLYLVQFINKRYGKNFTPKDFNKDKTAMINYILDQESLKFPGKSAA